MESVAVFVEPGSTLEREKKLAAQLNIPLIDDKSEAFDYLIFFEDDILKIKEQQSKSGAVWVDFCRGKTAYRQKNQGKGKLPLSRACGIKQSIRPTIIDATAGLGQDAFVLATLGCSVVCLEQHPLIAALLRDGLKRAEGSESNVNEIVKNIVLIEGKAETSLQSIKAEVVYLDPMYPHEQNKKSAKVKKAMQLFRNFTGTTSDERLLFEAAMNSATKRVVVKRPEWADWLAERKPTFHVPGKTHRYDVYQVKK